MDVGSNLILTIILIMNFSRNLRAIFRPIKNHRNQKKSDASLFARIGKLLSGLELDSVS